MGVDPTVSRCERGQAGVCNVKALVGIFNQEKALVGAFSVIVKPSCNLRFKL